MLLSKASWSIQRKFRKLELPAINKICKGALEKHLVNIQLQIKSKSFKKFVLSNKNKDIVGFGIIKQESKDAMYLEFLCSNTKGGGSKLLNAIEKYVKSKGNKVLMGESLSTSKGFYQKKKYTIITIKKKIMFYKQLSGRNDINKVIELIK